MARRPPTQPPVGSPSITSSIAVGRLLVCFVYDPLGRIGNPEGLERDLSGVKDGLPVNVLIAPRT